MIIKKIRNFFRKKREKKQKMVYTNYGSVNRCVSCGVVIPEGRQVCVRCEWGLR